jgi:hypothetical protein
MKAKVIQKQLRGTNQRTNRWELRHGERGTGKLIAAVQYWPDSPRSVENAERHIFSAARRAGVEVIWD